MNRQTTFGALAVLTLSALLLVPQPLVSQGMTRIPPGQVTRGSTDAEGFAYFQFDAPAAGVLTVVVRSLDGSDLVLFVADADGQPLANARSDQDLGSDAGAEQFAVTLPRAGSYQVGVETYASIRSSFNVGVSWLSFPDLEQAPDPDGSPSSAIVMEAGQGGREDSIDGAAGDNWDWYVFRATGAGTLTVSTQSSEGDLVLEAFEPGNFTESVARSDQDLQGSPGNEAVTLMVEAGQEFYFKVSAFSEGAAISYRLQMGLMGG